MFIELLRAIAIEIEYQADRACINNRRHLGRVADTKVNRALWRAGKL